MNRWSSGGDLLTFMSIIPKTGAGQHRLLRRSARPIVGHMPLLGDAIALPFRPCRVLVAGTSGSGKTAWCTRIATVLRVPHIEIDALYHGPDWKARPTFVDDVNAMVAQPSWVTEWQYGQARDRLAAAADLMVWLDLSRSRVIWQVSRRTVRRRLKREQLWNGNVEPPLRTFFTDDEHIVRWAWRTHDATKSRITAALETRPDLHVVRLGSHAAAARWVRGPLTRAAFCSGDC